MLRSAALAPAGQRGFHRAQTADDELVGGVEVLDKDIVIDAWVRVLLVGIDLLSVEARVIVASFETYLKYSDALAQSPTVSRGGGSLVLWVVVSGVPSASFHFNPAGRDDPSSGYRYLE